MTHMIRQLLPEGESKVSMVKTWHSYYMVATMMKLCSHGE